MHLGTVSTHATVHWLHVWHGPKLFAIFRFSACQGGPILIMTKFVVWPNGLYGSIIMWCLPWYHGPGRCINPFLQNDTFWRVWKRSLLKTLWEKEKLLVQAISPFHTLYSTLSKTEIIIFVTFNLSSANAFNLDQSKILSIGKGLSPFCQSMAHF